jgi:hypothetical protein
LREVENLVATMAQLSARHCRPAAERGDSAPGRSVAVRAAAIAAASHMGPGGPTRDNGGYGVVRKAMVETDQSVSRDDPDYEAE